MNHDNGTGLLHAESTWPSYDETALVRSGIGFVIQVNGKLLNIVAG